MPGIIFVTRCLINGKPYVGLCTTGDKNYLGSGTVLALAIKKYGRTNFVRTDLDTFLELAEGQVKERRWIVVLNSKAPAGYNLCDGGEGLFNPSEETRAKLRAHNAMKRPEVKAKLRCAKSPEHRAKIRAMCANPIWRENISKKNKGNKYTLGYHHTSKSREAISIAHWGKPKPWLKGRHPSEETRAKISISGRMAWARLEVKEKHSMAQKGKPKPWQKGRKSPMLGRKHSLESRQKMSKSHTGNKLTEAHRLAMRKPKKENLAF